MVIKVENIFRATGGALGKEVFLTLLERESVKIERIVSHAVPDVPFVPNVYGTDMSVVYGYTCRANGTIGTVGTFGTKALFVCSC